ncbi:O-methyltransferase [Fictibacillus barbaricus]|uniref:tRNA 5-hydroxyuridine methyltransferase n=1 Tax=Fictibacillus barbaricus TaxID=182136 RepID=A0ABS2ZJJ9_9BACL|nr:O-methyltransferase [Fictibacillus barbaricus]MBN3547513.1 O-methyltransferase [Fictibacillus barbaricus]GGB49534.1 putative O-methyltransferase YrrM [Fictibacillus barbaricus]
MVSNEVNQYIEKIIPARSEQVLKIEQYAKLHNVPIMELTGMETLLSYVRLKKPKRILEVGTAIGYSAIRMALACQTAEIISIERDEERYNIAKENVESFHLENRITLLFGDANELQKQVENYAPYDFIFIDAAKGQYQNFFDHYSSMLSPDGIIVTDNVLFRGYVAEESGLESRRLRSLVKKIRSFNEYIMQHPDYQSSILPVGDGMMVSIRNS